MFKDLNFERTEILIEGNPANNNLLDINSYAPLEEEIIDTKEDIARKKKLAREQLR